MKYIIILTTIQGEKNARLIAKALVEKRLAACVQITRINSVYRWKGKIEEDVEHLCLIKSRENLYPEVEAEIKRLHPYETPEIIALPIKYGSEEYLQWVERETS